MSEVMKMKTIVFVISMLLFSDNSFACSVGGELPKPQELVRFAKLIVVATAETYVKRDPEFKEGELTTGPSNSTIRFRIKTVLKGKYTEPTIEIPGQLVGTSDFNEGEVPYDFIRPGGRSGSCIASLYQTGGTFLLMLVQTNKSKDYTPSAQWTPWFAPLSATNEQVRGLDDPWVLWVKKQIK